MIVPAAAESTRIRLHPLQMRPEGDEWYVGRGETGAFVALPEVAVEALHLFERGLTVRDVAARLRETRGDDIDIAGFVDDLVDLGYVAAVDDQPVAGPLQVRPTWPWLRASHVRWTLSRPVAATALVMPLCVVAVLVVRPDLIPTYRDLLWSQHGTVVLATNTAIGWAIVFLHELAHLATARAAGVPGRISFGTRLQFLAVQTDVTGIWTAPRRIRVTVYLAGIAVNLAIAAVAVAGRLVVGPGTTAGAVLGTVVILSLLSVPVQFMLFMRTDLYFLLQDLTGCRNLYADGSAYARYQLRRVWLAVAHRPAVLSDPTAGLPRRERRTVRAYMPLLVLGTALSLFFAVAVTIPVAVTLVTRAARGLTGVATTTGERIDGALTLLVVGGFWALWCRSWWQRHGPRATAWIRRHPD